ncbi:secA translation cis-regulator SecM [[Erwinia] mediterraneensis]|uniref:secA translation cis-regulator SecM n=1 Tax=[Erwinia] mediterraneensis TaxID=2161819 RepID=UPI001EEE8B5C|nr:secA translation cis-regulator SecM [[Erwinia] mediterraneensis]
MIGILFRWRQFGRRFFWPHLLFGMVAASLGLPVGAQGAGPDTAAEKPSSSQVIGNAVRFDHLIRLQEAARRPSFTVDYWHQHAIRTVIRHLSFTLAPQHLAEQKSELPLAVQQLALIDSLHALLTHQPQPVSLLTLTEKPLPPRAGSFHGGRWLAQVLGIRAGPASDLC